MRNLRPQPSDEISEWRRLLPLREAARPHSLSRPRSRCELRGILIQRHDVAEGVTFERAVVIGSDEGRDITADVFTPTEIPIERRGRDLRLEAARPVQQGVGSHDALPADRAVSGGAV